MRASIVNVWGEKYDFFKNVQTKLPGAHEDFNHNLRVRCGRESMVCLAMLSIKTSPILANQPLGTYLFLRPQYTGNKARFLKKIESQLLTEFFSKENTE